MKPRSRKQKKKNKRQRKKQINKLEILLQKTFRRIKKENPSFSEDKITYLTILEIKKNQQKKKPYKNNERKYILEKSNCKQPVEIKKTDQKLARKISSGYRHSLLAKINQGLYDTEKELLTLRENALNKKEDEILNAVHQRLKIIAPEIYRKLVGPLHIRDPLGIKQCYCGKPASLSQIADEIITNSISRCCLLCDDCWKEDICSVWGYYGAWGAKIIDKETWRAVCESRGDTKYATY